MTDTPYNVYKEAMNKAPRQNPSEPVGDSDARLDSAAFHRNQVPIWEVLSPWLRTNRQRAGGRQRHRSAYRRIRPAIAASPLVAKRSSSRNLDSINAWRRLAQAQNIEPARRIDLSAPDWGLNSDDSATLSELTAIFCANVLHISLWATTEGLMQGAAQRLHPGGRLFVYGPFKQDGQHTAPSNEAFDASLRA